MLSRSRVSTNCNKWAATTVTLAPLLSSVSASSLSSRSCDVICFVSWVRYRYAAGESVSAGPDGTSDVIEISSVMGGRGFRSKSSGLLMKS